MTRALLALLVAAAGLMVSLYASGLTAKNHALAKDLHSRERSAQMRAAGIDDLFIRVRGRIVGDSTMNNAQDEGAVSGSSNPGGSRALGSDVFSEKGDRARRAAP